MRIAMVHWAFPPVIGGVESHLATLCPALAARGAEVSLLTGSIDGLQASGTWGGMPLVRTPLLDLNHLREGRAAGQLHAAVRREIAQFLESARPNLVHAHNMHYFSAAHLDVLSGWCQEAGVPLVLTAHNVWDDSLWRHMCSRARVWDRTIAVSHYIEDELASERVAVVHHGLDTERFRPQSERVRRLIRGRYPALAGRRVIFHPARSSVAKGSLVAIAALKEIRGFIPAAILVCAGAGAIVDWDNVQSAELQEIRQVVRDAELAGHVLIRSFTWEEMADLYQVADVTIYPSLYEEPFGLGVLEAMASGSPVVVSHSGGMPEFVADGRTGYVVPQGDPHALAERCVELLTRPRRAAVMSGLARRSVLNHHTVTGMTNMTWQVYQSALADGNGATAPWAAVPEGAVSADKRDVMAVRGDPSA
jgi:glycosyltransferase involved in cell wall biosynthesis